MPLLQTPQQRLAGLRRLAQPFFLPLDAARPGRPAEGDASGAILLLLVLAMLALVLGLGLVLISVAVGLASRSNPALLETLLPGLTARLGAIWHGAWGPGLMALALAGLGSFLAQRRRLRQGRWLPWLVLATITLLILMINAINVGISFVARNIENALVGYQPALFWRIVLLYALCLLMALPVRALQSYLVPRLGLLWRRWLSDDLLGRYLQRRAYYQLDVNGGDGESPARIDNPDQRIAQDVASFTSTSLSVVVDVIDALLTFVSFILVLCSISGRLALMLLVYAAAGTALVLVASRKLVRLNGQQLQLDADFRYALVHIRDHAESIAFYRGEAQEQRQAERRLGRAIRNADRLILWEAMISVVQQSYDYFSDFLPWLAIAPIYFAHTVDYGVFGQASIAFSQVLASVSYIVSNVDRLAAFSASIQRLGSLEEALAAIGAASAAAASSAAAFATPVGPARSLELRRVDLAPPGSDRLLVRDLSLEVGAGQRLLVMGPSGCGKTSLLRLMGGLWPPLDGSVVRPEAGTLMFLPQKPYMLLGSLREQLCYPGAATGRSDAELRSALEEVRLGELARRYPDLDIRQDWPRLLSLGEQQRLAFARLLLNGAEFAVLDEATSALDVASERWLYERLIDRRLALVSVGHRPSLRPLHQQLLALDGCGGWRLSACDDGAGPADRTPVLQ